MSRYTGPIFKISRRLNFSILENNKEFIKSKVQKNNTFFNKKRKPKIKAYGLQIREIQKIKFMYGITKKKLKLSFNKSINLTNNKAYNILIYLESRLDNIVFRMNFAPSRKSARQMVRHGNILVNNKKIDIPSYILKVNDVIEVGKRLKENKIVLEAIAKRESTLPYIELNSDKLSGIYKRFPDPKELNSNINVQLIIENLSR